MDDYGTAGNIGFYEKYEWCQTWWEHANDATLPRVLLIGDSITVGYHLFVKKLLAGKAHADQYASSRAIDAQAFNLELAHMLALYPYRVIHFNNGLHGWHVSGESYRLGLVAVIEQIKTTQPDARLILATSTPIIPPMPLAKSDQDKEILIQERNRIVADIAAAHHLPVVAVQA